MSDKKQIAEALRLAATYLGSGLHDNAVESLQRQANALDPPCKVCRSLRGWVLVVNKQGQKSMMYADANGIGYWSEHGTRFSWDDVELYGWKVTKLHILQPDEVAVSILPTSEWPHGCEFIRIVLLFESATGRTINESFERIFDRKDAERMEAEND